MSMASVSIHRQERRRRIAISYSQCIFTADRDALLTGRRDSVVWNRLARQERIADLLGLARVSIPRCRFGTVKLKQGQPEALAGGGADGAEAGGVSLSHDGQEPWVVPCPQRDARRVIPLTSADTCRVAS